MTHPKLDGEETAVTTQVAFDEVWSTKGWKLVTDAAEPAPKSSPAQAPVTAPKIGA
jgi:hypothetical protein